MSNPDHVHFHEVGSLDAIADVVGCCLLLEQLNIDRVTASQFTLGSGFVRCAHGMMPVPVPAVLHLLSQRQAPHLRLEQQTGELTTPTGAAIVCELAESFTSVSQVATRIGYGAGHKVIPDRLNVCRAWLLESSSDKKENPQSQLNRATSSSLDSRNSSDSRHFADSLHASNVAHDVEPTLEHDCVDEWRCQIDDSSGEAIAVLIEQLMQQGAKDAYATPIVMKKGRPAWRVALICDPQLSGPLASWVLQHSNTIGIRRSEHQRLTLPRRQCSVTIAGHNLSGKVVTTPDGTERFKPEADEVMQSSKRIIPKL